MNENYEIQWTRKWCLHCNLEIKNFSVSGYCKSGNIRGGLIFAIFAQNWVSSNSKTGKNICLLF